jgi:aspartyl-tRNA(Asn)/glutamyl-tRNA(Gln) amidotransferase subunit C
MEDFKAIIDYLAALAHLDLSPGEKELLARQLSAILDAAAKVQELDTRGIEPVTHVISTTGMFREDEVMPSLKLEEVLANVPRCEKGYIKVPRMFRNLPGR